MREIILDFDVQLNNNMLFINELCSKISKCKKIYLFSSYESNDAAKYFQDIMMNQDIEVYFTEIRPISTKIIQNIGTEIPILLLLNGVDNQFLIDHLEVVDKKILLNNLFIITSESQQDKIKNFHSKFVIGSSKYFAYMFRRLFFDYLFIFLYTKLSDNLLSN
ncbi:hypothetical protein SCLARK_001214 [Spiroplasma clarkii]|uniref:hypothetical protein n=1 Tax=Spiroplasma clarkii TaxID=2139 RepID=UPI000B5702E1|nr:hypothetical protein [Spiroplasma clarkii]ARU91766.1 hypothetical protein SCLARK_001214 [Spiroplasma clarkii]